MAKLQTVMNKPKEARVHLGQKTTGVIYPQLGSAVFLFLPHFIPLCSLNDFHIKLPGSSSRFQYNKKCPIFFLPNYCLCEIFFWRLKLSVHNSHAVNFLFF